MENTMTMEFNPPVDKTNIDTHPRFINQAPLKRKAVTSNTSNPSWIFGVLVFLIGVVIAAFSITMFYLKYVSDKYNPSQPLTFAMYVAIPVSLLFMRSGVVLRNQQSVSHLINNTVRTTTPNWETIPADWLKTYQKGRKIKARIIFWSAITIWYLFLVYGIPNILYWQNKTHIKWGFIEIHFNGWVDFAKFNGGGIQATKNWILLSSFLLIMILWMTTLIITLRTSMLIKRSTTGVQPIIKGWTKYRTVGILIMIFLPILIFYLVKWFMPSRKKGK